MIKEGRPARPLREPRISYNGNFTVKRRLQGGGEEGGGEEGIERGRAQGAEGRGGEGGGPRVEKDDGFLLVVRLL